MVPSMRMEAGDKVMAQHREHPNGDGPTIKAVVAMVGALMAMAMVEGVL